MELGIADKEALICASSEGLGKACATALSCEGVRVVINGRRLEPLQAAAEEIYQISGTPVRYVQADVSTEEGRKKIVESCPNADILINNNGGPKPVGFQESSTDDWHAAVEANMLAPIFLIQALLPGMRERGFGRIINITSAMVKTPEAVMCISSSTRTALTALSKAVSKEAIADNVTINNLLPEMFDTGRQQKNAEMIMSMADVTYEQARELLVARIAAKRMGLPKEFGDTCAFLCSQQASYISGQNLQLDGGSYSGLI